MHLCTVPKRVQNDSRLNSRESLVAVELNDPVHILREIQYHRDIAALTGQTCARPSCQNWSAVLPACRYRRNDICVIAGHDQANRNLPVIRPVRGIQRSAPSIEPYFTTQLSLEFLLQFQSLRERVHGFCMRAQRFASFAASVTVNAAPGSS